MAKIHIDGVDFEVPDQAAQAVGKLQSRLADAEEETQTEAEKLKAKEDEMEEAEKKAKKSEDSLQAKLDTATSKIPTADTLDKLVTDRSDLIAKVVKIAPDVKWEGKDAATLRKEVVALLCPAVQMDSASADYIDARFDTLVEDVETNSQHNLDEAISKQVTDEAGKVIDNRPASVIARDNMIKRSQDAWKKEGDKK